MSAAIESLGMHREFNNGESPLLTPGIEGMLRFAGLEAFIENAKNLIRDKSNPFFDQANLLFIHYRRKAANLHTEAMGTQAAKKLLGDFGVAGIGIDQETGAANDKITSLILETHDDLTSKVETSSRELPISIKKFTTFIATTQRSIVELLIKSQENSLLELNLKEKEEERVREHLNSTTSQQTVVYESVSGSKKAQIERRKKDSEEEEGITHQLSTLFAFAQKMFEPAQKGTQEMRLAPIIG